MKLLIILLALILSGPTWTFASSGNDGGGGDVVITPDDDVVLADPFLNSNAPQPNNMPPMRSLNPRILHTVKSYLDVIKPTLGFFMSLRPIRPIFWESSIYKQIEKLTSRQSELRFYGVQNQAELNQFCAPGGEKKYILPEGYTVKQVACTAGNETFLVEPLFAQLSLKDQALLLIHERLTTITDTYGGKNYSAIARFTTGLGTFINVYKTQNGHENRIVNYKLTSTQVERLSQMYLSIEEIDRLNQDPLEDSFPTNPLSYLCTLSPRILLTSLSI